MPGTPKVRSHTFPTMFIPHGAGPCFFMDWEPANTWNRMEAWLRGIVNHAGAMPEALVVVSAHWEAPVFTVNTSPTPELLYDYAGFPEHTSRIEWAAPSSPELGERILHLLTEAGIQSREDRTRGLDHGVFIPMKLAFPYAEVPVVQVSLKAGLDPAMHLSAGRALAPLRRERVLIIGSGMSYHNMQRFRVAGGPVDPDSQRFDDWLLETVGLTRPERDERLRRWMIAPGGRASHPREEHLLPLHVVAGAAADDIGEGVFRDQVLGSFQSAFRFGSPVSSGVVAG